MSASFPKQTGETHLPLPLASSSGYTARGPMLPGHSGWALKLKLAKSQDWLAQQGWVGWELLITQDFHISSLYMSFLYRSVLESKSRLHL